MSNRMQALYSDLLWRIDSRCRFCGNLPTNLLGPGHAPDCAGLALCDELERIDDAARREGAREALRGFANELMPKNPTRQSILARWARRARALAAEYADPESEEAADERR